MPVAMNPYYRTMSIENEKQKLLANPHLIANAIVDNLGEFFPGVAKPPTGKQYPNKLTALQAGLDKDHPLYDLPEQAYSAVTQALQDPDLYGYTANQIIGTVATDQLLTPSAKRSSEPKLFDSYRDIRRREGTFWSGEKIAKPRGYDEWLQAQRAYEDKKLEEEGWLPSAKQMSDAMALGLGVGTALGVATGPAAPGAAPAMAAAGMLSMIPFEFGAHGIGRWLHGTEWYRAKVDSDSFADKVKTAAADLLIPVAGGAGAGKFLQTSAARANDILKGVWRSKEELERVREIVARSADPENLIELGAKTKIWNKVAPTADELLEVEGRKKYGAVYDQIAAMQKGEMGLEGTVLGKPISPAAGESVPSLIAGHPVGLDARSSAEWIKENAATELEFYEGERARIYDYGAKIDPWDKPEQLPAGREAFSRLTDEAMDEALANADAGRPIAEAVSKAMKEQNLLSRSEQMEADWRNRIGVWEERQKELKRQQELRDKYTAPILNPEQMHAERLKELREAGFPEEELAGMSHEDALIALEDFKQEMRRLDVVEEARSPHTIETIDRNTARAMDIERHDAIANWLEHGGEKPQAPTKLYRGIPKGSEPRFGIEFTHGTPWVEQGGKGGKGGFGSYESNDIYSYPADENTLYYRGGSLSGDPLETTRIDTSTGKTWDQILDEAKLLYRRVVRREADTLEREIPDPTLRRSFTRNLATNKANEVVRDIYNATFEADIKGAPGIWAGRGVPPKLRKATPSLRSNTELEEIVDTYRQMGMSEEFIRELPEQRILNRVGLKTIGVAGIALGTGIVSLGSLLAGGDEAEAGMIDGFVSKAITPFIKAGVEKNIPVKSMIDSLAKMGYEFKSVDLANPYTPIPPAEGLNLASAATKEIGGLSKALARTKRTGLGATERIMTAQKALLYYKEPYSPHIELGSRQAAWQWNIKENSKVLLNIMKEIPDAVKTSNRAQKEVEAVMQPLADTYSADVVAYSIVEQKISKLQSLLEKTKVESDVARKAQNELARLTEIRTTLEPNLKKFQGEWESVVSGLSKKYPTVRMYLAAEDTADNVIYPWLKGKLSFKEKVGVARLKSMNQYYAARMEAIGEDVITDRPYMQHSWHPAWDEKKITRRLSELNLQDLAEGVPYSKFFSRNKYSLAMMPEVTYSQIRYINDTEKRIQISQFWNKKNSNGWYQHAFNKEYGAVHLSPALRDFWQDLTDKLAPQTVTPATQWANRYALFDMIRLIGWSPSTGFKHLFKQTGTMSTLGVRNTVSTMPSAALIAARNWVRNNLSPEIQNQLGLSKALSESKIVDDFVAAVGGRNKLQNIMQDLDIRHFGQTVADDVLQRVATQSGMLVGAAEAFDRSNSILASILMSHKSGLTGTQALYAIYDTVLKNNFVGGVMNASWMRSPYVRAMMMFQSTPFKIAERRLIQAYKTQRSVSKAYDIIPGDTIFQKLQTLAGVKSYIKQGEQEFKRGIIKDALYAEKDTFGTPYTKQLMKELLMSGLIIGGGASLLGVDFNPQVGHLPFLKYTSHDPTIALSPVIQSAFKTMADRSRAAKRGEEPEFFITNYVNNWLGKESFMPLVIHKMARISNNDIPAIYRDSGLQYLFSVPSIKKRD